MGIEEKIETEATILVVEDDESLNRLIQRTLKRVGFRVETALNGAEAIAKVVENQNVILLLDYLLPDMTGKEVIEVLAEGELSVPFIIMTGHGDEKIAIEMMKLGARDYTIKDLNFNDILPQVIKRVCEELNKENRLAEAEKALQESEDRFRRLAENAQDIIYRYRFIPTRGFEYVSPACTAITGYTPEEHYADPDLDLKLIHPDDRHKLENFFKGKGVFGQPIVLRWNRKDGTIIWTEQRNVPIYDNAGNLAAIEGIGRDITERKQSEEELCSTNYRLQETLTELRTTQQQVIQQERLRALGQLASGIAHDFNNALTSILGFSELILMAPEILDHKEKVKHYLKCINTTAIDATNVVKRLREFYRKREDNEVFAPVNINQLVKQAIELTQPKWKDQALANNITISISTDLQEIPHVNGNESELREVLTNLIFNAVDAMPTNGTITLHTHSDNEDVFIEVQDTGIGMTEEVKLRCFDPFFTTKNKQGTGLGLSIAHGVVSRHEGTIKILSEPGDGTTFTVSLPIHIKSQDKERAQETEAISRSLHVLVVDDEQMVRDVITQYLLVDGYTFETATNGREGLEKFYKDKFDLLIIDRAMPGLNGIQLARLIKQIAPNKPIIMLTGFGDMMKEFSEMPEGIDYLVSKPVKLNDFREVLAKVKNYLSD